jgi:hypothetical protein
MPVPFKLQLVVMADDHEVCIDDVVVLDKQHEQLEHVGLSLGEAKALLMELQRQVVTRQAGRIVCVRAVATRSSASRFDDPSKSLSGSGLRVLRGRSQSGVRQIAAQNSDTVSLVVAAIGRAEWCFSRSSRTQQRLANPPVWVWDGAFSTSPASERKSHIPVGGLQIKPLRIAVSACHRRISRCSGWPRSAMTSRKSSVSVRSTNIFRRPPACSVDAARHPRPGFGLQQRLELDDMFPSVAKVVLARKRDTLAAPQVL